MAEIENATTAYQIASGITTLLTNLDIAPRRVSVLQEVAAAPWREPAPWNRISIWIRVRGTHHFYYWMHCDPKHEHRLGSCACIHLPFSDSHLSTNKSSCLVL